MCKPHAKMDTDPHHKGCDLILGPWPRLMGFPVPALWLTCVQDADNILAHPCRHMHRMLYSASRYTNNLSVESKPVSLAKL